jgi:hypothetical protein
VAILDGDHAVGELEGTLVVGGDQHGGPGGVRVGGQQLHERPPARAVVACGGLVCEDHRRALGAGQGGALYLAGEPGIGKTALIGEALARSRQRGYLTLSGRAAEFELELPVAVGSCGIGQSGIGQRGGTCSPVSA